MDIRGPGVAERSPLALAFVGDAVLSLMIRERAMESGDNDAGRLTEAAARLASARAQSVMYSVVAPSLSSEEAAVMRRGRNANPRSRAKNAAVAEYRRATGLEALFGWLRLMGRDERARELFIICVEAYELGESQKAKNIQGNKRAETGGAYRPPGKTAEIGGIGEAAKTGGGA
ncbi:MAG: ribonuclease III [Clostridiales bacterium]|jgi:ribonuclease-3 family protein|nr:ribonuclease III [Clostridiales bacterium]